ncbi:response regulator [Cupriavidus basilensis]|uniref:Response regulator n=1 Tax=Cupriavidus basilensis TaxID=68895 RepID=A0ABT6AJ96_9BURK|nr:response regulator [Cupriavidus basilensis]MDF3832665.1 response regulator [Cupriavidus basilensis]
MTPAPDLQTRVLVVDDNADARGFLARALGGEAMAVHAAHSGDAALAALAFFEPDAVLLDVDMPGMDGFATCAAMVDRHADLPVIFMTGLGETGHIVRGFEVGGCDYVTKPVAVAEVVARVRSHAAKARLARSAREAVLGSAVAMLAASAGGQLMWMNASAAALLQAHGWAAVPPGGTLAPPLAGALQALQEDPGTQDLRLGGLRLRRLTGVTAGVTVVELAAQAAAGDGAAPAELTPREAEVMVWVARGKTNRDVAEILGMSPRTVNKHLEHIYEKLGVETRTAAVAAARRGLA